MLLEGLVILACVQGEGCSQSTGAYYRYNRDAQILVKNAENYGKSILYQNEYLVYVGTPLYAALAGKPMRFNMGKGWMFKMDLKNEGVGLEWSY
jgi:hypothetical protein